MLLKHLDTIFINMTRHVVATHTSKFEVLEIVSYPLVFWAYLRYLNIDILFVGPYVNTVTNKPEAKTAKFSKSIIKTNMNKAKLENTTKNKGKANKLKLFKKKHD